MVIKVEDIQNEVKISHRNRCMRIIIEFPDVMDLPTQPIFCKVPRCPEKMFSGDEMLPSILLDN